MAVSKVLNPHLFPQGKGEFTMEYQQHAPVPADVQAKLAAAHKTAAARN